MHQADLKSLVDNLETVTELDAQRDILTAFCNTWKPGEFEKELYPNLYEAGLSFVKSHFIMNSGSFLVNESTYEQVPDQEVELSQKEFEYLKRLYILATSDRKAHRNLGEAIQEFRLKEAIQESCIKAARPFLDAHETSPCFNCCSMM